MAIAGFDEQGALRGFCPSCGARRMVESAALLVDEVLSRLPMRQWVLSFPYPLRFLFTNRSQVMSHVVGIVYRAIETHLLHHAGLTRSTTKTGAVTLIQRFGSALNIHFHMLFWAAYRSLTIRDSFFAVFQPPSSESGQINSEFYF